MPNNNNNNVYGMSTSDRSRTLTRLQFQLEDNTCDVNILTDLVNLYDVTKDDDDNVNNEIKTIIKKCINNDNVKKNKKLMSRINNILDYSSLNVETFRPKDPRYNTINSAQAFIREKEERRRARANQSTISVPASSGPGSSGYESASSAESPYNLAMPTPTNPTGPEYAEVSPGKKPEYATADAGYEELEYATVGEGNNEDPGKGYERVYPRAYRPLNKPTNSTYMQMNSPVTSSTPGSTTNYPYNNSSGVRPVDPFNPPPHAGGARKNKSYKSKKANKAKKANKTSKASKVKKTKKAKMNTKSRARKNTKRNGNNVNTGRNVNNVNLPYM